MNNRGPLAGLLVIDFGQGAAGPYCAMLLGDYGARVIKIEPPRGDWGRAMGAISANGNGPVHIALNRNKEALCLDLSKPQGLAIVRRMVEMADIIVENFRPGVMNRLKLGFDDLATKKRGLVYCSITGFGDSGPYADLPAGDSILQPMSGFMSLSGEAAGPPMRSGMVVSDMVAGMNGAQGVLLALMKARTSGESQLVKTSLMESIIAFQAGPATEYLITGKQPNRVGNNHPMICPSGAFQSTDGWVYFTVLDHQWKGFCSGFGVPEIADHPDFATNEARMKNRDRLNGILQEKIGPSSVAQCLKLFREIDVLAGPVNDYEDVRRDAQVNHLGMFFHVSHPTLGEAPMIRSPLTVSGFDIPYTYPPMLGEHTREILQNDLGLTVVEVEKLIADGTAITPR